jgi:hypothetical protein
VTLALYVCFIVCHSLTIQVSSLFCLVMVAFEFSLIFLDLLFLVYILYL